MGILERMLPAIDRIPNVLGDTWETIAGDVDATWRFSDRLQHLRAVQARTRRTSDRPPVHWRPERRQVLRERLLERRRSAPDALTAIPIGHAAPLIMAAVHARQGNAAAIFDKLPTTMDQLAAHDRPSPVLAEA